MAKNEKELFESEVSSLLDGLKRLDELSTENEEEEEKIRRLKKDALESKYEELRKEMDFLSEKLYELETQDLQSRYDSELNEQVLAELRKVQKRFNFLSDEIKRIKHPLERLKQNL